MNLSAPLVPFVSILGCRQRVEYEGLFLICFACGKYGHRPDHCPTYNPQTNPEAMEETPAPADCGGTGNIYGPWMLPTSTRRRSPPKARSHRRPGEQVSGGDKTGTGQPYLDEPTAEGPWEVVRPRRRAHKQQPKSSVRQGLGLT